MKSRFLSRHHILLFIISMISYLLWCIIYSNIEQVSVADSNRVIVSLLGVMLYLLFIIIWKQMNGKWLTFISIFITFFFIFNFGQSIFWAFGFHIDGELGTRKLFDRYYTNIDIYRAQWIFIICFILFNFGAMLFRNKKASISNFKDENDLIECFTVLSVSKLIALFSIPAAYYVSFRNFLIARTYNYHYIYFGDEGLPTLIVIANALFFPSLIGLLLGSNYNEKYRKLVYGLFAGFAILSMLCGDRGEWINKLIILIWVDHTYNRPLSIKKIFFYIVLALLSLNIISAIVSVRNSGISLSNIINGLKSSNKNPIISMIIEFGNSMGINSICLGENVKYPYGNTYITSILTMPTSTIGKWIYGPEYRHLSNWFSREYLQINIGSDFTIISEAIVNFGAFFAPIILFVEGIIISKFSDISLKPKRIINSVIIIGCMPYLIKIARSTVWYVMNKVFLSCFIYYIMYYLLYPTIKRRNNQKS